MSRIPDFTPDQSSLTTYYLRILGNYIFIEEFSGIEAMYLTKSFEIQISNSSMNSITQERKERPERIAIVLSNNVNVFTFQKYTEYFSEKEEEVLYFQNRFFFFDKDEDYQEGTFNEDLIYFLSKNTGFEIIQVLQNIKQ